MAEFEVHAHLEGETDIDIDFDAYTDKDKLKLIRQILLGEKVTFEENYVELEGECYVEIEPQERE